MSGILYLAILLLRAVSRDRAVSDRILGDDDEVRLFDSCAGVKVPFRDDNVAVGQGLLMEIVHDGIVSRDADMMADGHFCRMWLVDSTYR